MNERKRHYFGGPQFPEEFPSSGMGVPLCNSGWELALVPLGAYKTVTCLKCRRILRGWGRL